MCSTYLKQSKANDSLTKKLQFYRKANYQQIVTKNAIRLLKRSLSYEIAKLISKQEVHNPFRILKNICILHSKTETILAQDFSDLFHYFYTINRCLINHKYQGNYKIKIKTTFINESCLFLHKSKQRVNKVFSFLSSL